MTDINELARHLLASHTGIGMTPPFYAETGSAKGKQDWPHWIVRNRYCNSLGRLMPGRWPRLSLRR
ncbi:hypothetical protein M2192_001621 [Bradyrhizobium elkanii USDA 61]|uniref:Uncharacterized protein n=1 Tax=Bradyrhizobium elkanii TaxID=29448 RepID=A0A8I1YC04_BRAEL|nr:hypothetical protein [Bradyrhizobium elkanii]MCS4004661.1 hypothetical protein [Bradyrhizobium elkanii USDA 61]MCP1932089.1 hypothetical protein [Bradyrhizobium elkanii]MCS3577368.1 hypothetical protein [Bradyrhizobium elkanii]MCS3720244.1 hypothetical protein [Bradyrhizobium elkanii]